VDGDSDSDSDSVDLATAAEQLGVHYQTAYKWVRAGTLPARRVGGRYLLDPADVARLADERTRPAPPPRRRPRRGFDDLAARMQTALLDGDERTARSLVDGLVRDGVPLTDAIQQVIAPGLRHIGTEWHDGRLPIWVEHRAAAIVDRILGEQHPTPRGRRRGTAVVAALSGDTHTLPTSMAAAALREDNWRVHHLGADMPPDELVRFGAEHPVDLVVLTVTVPEVADDAAATAARLEADGVRTLVGRPGATLTDLVTDARAR
jgi:excisionase family DNA binding protein